MSEERRSYAPDYVSAETLAYRLDCPRSTIDVCVRNGYLPKPHSIGNLQRWDFGEVKAFIKAQNSARSVVTGQDEDEFLKGLESGASRKNPR
jgi:predicted DNA-binding transcriptional regulator AlpA